MGFPGPGRGRRQALQELTVPDGPCLAGRLWSYISSPSHLAVPDLLSLLEFLTAAPKSYVIKLHRREHPGEGLLPAAKVIQLVQGWALDKGRLERILRDLDDKGRYLLALAYVAGDRGAAETELFTAQDGVSPAQAAQILTRLEQDLLLYTRESETTRTYHGFEEMADLVLGALLPDLLPPAASGAESAGPGANAAWISYRHFLPAHLGHFLGRVELGAVKITQTGEMHRKDSQELAGRFSFGERLSASVPAEEVQFLLRFAVGRRLVEQEDSVLRLSAEGKALVRGTRAEAEQALREWWIGTRIRGLGPVLKAMASLAAGRVAPWANLLWIHSGNQRKSYLDAKSLITWENLPKALQEAWLLGYVDFGMAKGRIAWVRPGKDLAALLSDAPAQPSSRPVGLPNMETLVPLDAPFHWQRRMELVGLRSNDEFMARYRFTKESVIQGLQCGLGMEEFKELLAWLGYEGPAARTLLDWASTYASTLFMDALILKVSDPGRLRELQEIPQFMELVTEPIPGYGFVITRQNKPRVRELLHHFGLVPGEDSRRVPQLEPVVLDGGQWELPVPEIGPPSYRESGTVVRTAPQPAGERTAASREMDMAQRLELIEAAIEGGGTIEFGYPMPAPRRVTLKPLLLLRHRSPVKLIGVEVDSGHRTEYLLDQVKALKAVE